jgi:SSS family transporter
MNLNELIPIIIIVVFIIGIIIVGKIASIKIETSEDYLVAGRGAPLILVVGTLFATFWGGGTIIGATGAAYNDGIFGVVEDPFAAGLALILIGFIFVKILRKLNISSIGELYKLRFGQTTGYLASALMIPTYVIWTAVQLLAIGKILNVMFGINFNLTFILATVVIVSFTYMGGLLAVAWTDAIQMTIIFIGLIVILVVGINSAGGTSEIMANTPKDYWNILPREKNLSSWITYLAMWVGMGLGNIPSPDIAQRAFMAKDVKTAKRGMIIAGGLYWTVGFIPIIIGLIGITLVNKGILNESIFNADSELLIPVMAKELLGPVGMGIFVASLVAAIISSASTSLFATAVLFSNDIYKPLISGIKSKGDLDNKGMIGATRIFVVIVGLLSAIVGLLSSNIYDLTIFAFTLQFGVLFFPFVFALKSKSVNTYGIISGMIVGFSINAFGCIIQGSVIPEPWEFFTLIPALANMLVILTVSYITRNKQKVVPIELLYINENKQIKEN